MPAPNSLDGFSSRGLVEAVLLPWAHVNRGVRAVGAIMPQASEITILAGPGRREEGLSLNSASLTSELLASSVYLHVP